MIPAWLEVAFKDIGITETAGPEATARILEMHSKTKLGAKSDEVAWCAAALSCWLEEGCVNSLKTAWALDYQNYGSKLHEPRLGCIVVLKRGPANGHVGLYLGTFKDSIYVLGGNQSDAVTIQAFSKAALLSYRWPG